MIDSFDLELAAKMRRARRARGFQLSELAYAVGVSHDRLWRCEQGVDRFSIGELFRIARIMRLNPAYLLGAEPPRRQRRRPPAGSPANDNDREGLRIAVTFSRLFAELDSAMRRPPPSECC